MYKSLVEPHLTYGCEAALDVRPSSLKPLVTVQSTYLRRALGIGPRSQLTPLYTETGIWPLRYRRAALVLRWVRYVLRDEPTLALAAVREAWSLAQAGRSSWWSDLCHALFTLPVPVTVVFEIRPTVESISALLTDLDHSLALHLYKSVMESRRLPVVQARFRHLPYPPSLSQVCRPQPYLSLARTAHRESLVRLITSDHPLGIEEGRRHSPKVPRHRRICRFCHRQHAIEDEVHVLLECEDPRLTAARETLLLDALSPSLPGLRKIYHRLPSWRFLDFILSTERALPIVAQFIHAVFELVDTIPFFFVPDEETLSALEV